MRDMVPATTQVVDTRYAQDVIAVLDTGKFEHMQRVAMVMAQMTMLPETLRQDGAGVLFSERTILANCFRIVNQAVRWGLDPFAVVDCASIVRGRMMWEGKLIAAVLDAKLGIDLEYEFDGGKGDELGVTVIGTKPGQTKARTVFGRVKEWQTGGKGAWANPASWHRQLRYRGAREWARAHAPAVILGVYAEDEMTDAIEREAAVQRRTVRMRDVTPANFAKTEPAAPAVLPEIPEVPAPAPAPAKARATRALTADMIPDDIPDTPPVAETKPAPAKGPQTATTRARDAIAAASNLASLVMIPETYEDADWAVLEADYLARKAQIKAGLTKT